MVRTFVIACSVLAAAIVACQVYDPEDLVGNGAAGAASGGTGAGATGGTAGLGGTATSGNGGTTGDGGSSVNLEGGAGGEDPSGGTAGSGGTTGGAAGKGGTSGGGASGTGGNGGTGGGSGTGGAAGTGGATAGTSSSGAGGAGGAGTGGVGGTGGAGAGGAGAGGTTAGSAGMAGGTVVELPGTATASSSENTTSQMHPAAHGNDNDPATRWCAANGNTGHYWQVDLGAVHELTRFEVTWEYPTQAVGLFYLYAIGISDDGTTFTTVIDKTANADATATQSVDFPAGTMARHVRISIPGLPTGAWASFWEASVFGY